MGRLKALGYHIGEDVPSRAPLPCSRVQRGDHRLCRRGALSKLAGALRPRAGLHLGCACGGRQAHHAGHPSVSASGQASRLRRLGTPLVPPISAPPPAPPALILLLYRLRIGSGDVLTFYDGDDLTARVLGQYSGPRGHFKLFTSMADVTIQFQSDPGTSALGYQQGFVIHFFGELVLSDSDYRPIDL